MAPLIPLRPPVRGLARLELAALRWPWLANANNDNEDTMSGPRTFTIVEVAELLQCNRATVDRAIRARHLQAAKLGRVYRISQLDLNAWWQARGGGELFPEDEEGAA